jgi:hypothetical protein
LKKKKKEEEEEEKKKKEEKEKKKEKKEVQLYSFFNLGARFGWVVKATRRELYPRE